MIRRDSVLSSARLLDLVAKEAYHLPLEPASSGLFGEGLSFLLEQSDKIAEEKRQKALHEAVVRTVKPGKAKHSAPKGGGPGPTGIQEEKSHEEGWPALQAC